MSETVVVTNKPTTVEVTGGKGVAEVVLGGGLLGPQGESAYEVALANGFVGTEEEWLASLQGEQGIQGPPGTGDFYYVHDQPNAAYDWEVHLPVAPPAGKMPSVQVQDNTGRVVHGRVVQHSSTHYTLSFKVLFGGKATFN